MINSYYWRQSRCGQEWWFVELTKKLDWTRYNLVLFYGENCQRLWLRAYSTDSDRVHWVGIWTYEFGSNRSKMIEIYLHSSYLNPCLTAWQPHPTPLRQYFVIKKNTRTFFSIQVLKRSMIFGNICKCSGLKTDRMWINSNIFQEL